MDFSKYYSNDGMNTKVWGPRLWDFLFISVLGRYPVKIDKTNKEHCELRDHYKSLFTLLQFILPCVYCRNSYIKFLNELNLEKYLSGRIQLMYFIYSLKDKVNKKLQKQELLNYNKTKQKLKIYYNNGRITKEEYYKMLKRCAQKTFYVIPSPPFKDVLDKYEKYRAKCSNKTKSCSK